MNRNLRVLTALYRDGPIEAEFEHLGTVNVADVLDKSPAKYLAIQNTLEFRISYDNRLKLNRMFVTEIIARLKAIKNYHGENFKISLDYGILKEIFTWIRLMDILPIYTVIQMETDWDIICKDD